MTRKCCPQMLARLESGEADLVAGTRYVEGGSAASFSARPRRDFARWRPGSPTGWWAPISAIPCRGFFMMRRDRFDAIAPRLSPVGFKILLDIAATAGERLAHRRTAL